mgnify:CR=1 FL=1
MNEVNKRCQEIIEKLNLNPRVVTHEPILNYETAERVDKELGLTGTETKTLFLKGKSNNYYLFITLSDVRMDSKVLKSLFGEKVSLVNGEEITVKEKTTNNINIDNNNFFILTLPYPIISIVNKIYFIKEEPLVKR